MPSEDRKFIWILHKEKNDVSLSKDLKKQTETQSTERAQETSNDGRGLSSHLSDSEVPIQRLSLHVSYRPDPH